MPAILSTIIWAIVVIVCVVVLAGVVKAVL